MARELGPDRVHVAHVVVDGRILTPDAADRAGDRPEEAFLDPDGSRTSTGTSSSRTARRGRWNSTCGPTSRSFSHRVRTQSGLTGPRAPESRTCNGKDLHPTLVRVGMEAVVLAGGYATRLWPVTKNRPKMLLPGRRIDGYRPDPRRTRSGRADRRGVPEHERALRRGLRGAPRRFGV